MRRESGPPKGTANRTPAKKFNRKVTRRWTDLATNEPPADHEDPAYLAVLESIVDSGELEEVAP